MNFKVRLKNPQFWVQVFITIILSITAYNGIEPTALTTWESVFKLVVSALSNPYLLVLIGWNVYCLFIDLTTKGIGDSQRVLNYEVPNDDTIKHDKDETINMVK